MFDVLANIACLINSSGSFFWQDFLFFPVNSPQYLEHVSQEYKNCLRAHWLLCCSLTRGQPFLTYPISCHICAQGGPPSNIYTHPWENVYIISYFFQTLTWKVFNLQITEQLLNRQSWEESNVLSMGNRDLIIDHGYKGVTNQNKKLNGFNTVATEWEIIHN